MPLLTDIWFRTDMELDDIGQQIGLTDIRADAEDYWSWIIGGFGDKSKSETALRAPPRKPGGDTQ